MEIFSNLHYSSAIPRHGLALLSLQILRNRRLLTSTSWSESEAALESSSADTLRVSGGIMYFTDATLSEVWLQPERKTPSVLQPQLTRHLPDSPPCVDKSKAACSTRFDVVINEGIASMGHGGVS